MNRVLLIGRLTRDPETRIADNNLYITRLTLAVDRVSKTEKSADFIQCIAFGKTAELIDKYLRKGRKAAVEGRIQTSSYEDNGGNKKTKTEVVIERFDFIDYGKTEEVTDVKKEDLPEPTLEQIGFECLEEGVPF